MIIGIGVDQCSTKRIAALQQEFAARFLSRLLHSSELEQYEALSSEAQKTAYLTKRFAAKEAVAKALGTGIAGRVTLPTIAITNRPSGQPDVTLYEGTLATLNQRLPKGCTANIHVSMSDEESHAIAMVVIEALQS